MTLTVKTLCAGRVFAPMPSLYGLFALGLEDQTLRAADWG